MSDRHLPALLDSSVVVRYLTNNPPDLANAAARIIDSDSRLVLSELVLAETGYVLQSVYGVPRAQLVDALVGLVRRKNIELLNLPKELALIALSLCRGSNRVSFVDALLWAEARHAGANAIYTFDRRFPADGVPFVGGDEQIAQS